VTDAAAPRTRKTWDIVLTISLLAIDLITAVVLSYVAIFLVFASDSCGTGCNSALLSFATLFGFVSPYVAFVIGLVLSIVLLVRRRRAFWVPIVAFVLEIALLVGATALTFSAVA